MKKLLALALASILALSMVGCGNKNEVVQEPAATDANGNPIAGTAVEGAGEEVNLDALDGDKLAVADNGAKSETTMGDFEVSISDAKLFEFEGQKKVAVTFTFKNNGDNPRSFDNVMEVEIAQGGMKLVPGKVVVGVEGINILSASELIEKGNKTTVQKTYDIYDEENPIDVTVFEYSGTSGEAISKTFNVK